MIEALAVPAYRKLFSAQILALLGTGLLTVALGLLAFDLAGGQAGAVLGTALTIKMLADVFVAPLMAALVERLPKKAVLVGADLIRAGIALMLPRVDHAWQTYVLVFVLQSASATFTPAFQSLIPVVLPAERHCTRALSRLAYDLESLVSPALAAALLTVLSFHEPFLGTVAGFLFSAALVLTTRLPAAPAARQEGTLWHRTTLGARIFAKTPDLRGLMALNLAVAAATALVLVNTVIYARDLFAGSNADVAFALACYGAGSMAVALTAPGVLDRVPDRAFMGAGAVLLSLGLAGAFALLAVPGTWPVLLGLWALLGVGTSMINTPSARLLRRAATDSTRSYIFTAQFSLPCVFHLHLSRRRRGPADGCRRAGCRGYNQYSSGLQVLACGLQDRLRAGDHKGVTRWNTHNACRPPASTTRLPRTPVVWTRPRPRSGCSRTRHGCRSSGFWPRNPPMWAPWWSGPEPPDLGQPASGQATLQRTRHHPKKQPSRCLQYFRRSPDPPCHGGPEPRRPQSRR
ncbi:MFS transporter [Paenarthrobacter nicotinovorans]|uniref:MFS transporter n=1 Tax=Paenarthrobacter nicotinovorans TaxID=29320 RepID=UPI0028CB61C0|nr:MFS transporter [Paenarthrobacter nicotinovorans]